MKPCANRETAEALYLMSKQTMYTLIVGDKQPSRLIMTIMVYSYNSSIELKKEGKKCEELEKKKRVICKPITNGFRLENNSSEETSMIREKLLSLVQGKKYICIIFLHPLTLKVETKVITTARMIIEKY